MSRLPMPVIRLDKCLKNYLMSSFWHIETVNSFNSKLTPTNSLISLSILFNPTQKPSNSTSLISITENYQKITQNQSKNSVSKMFKKLRKTTFSKKKSHKILYKKAGNSQICRTIFQKLKTLSSLKSISNKLMTPNNSSISILLINRNTN